MKEETRRDQKQLARIFVITSFLGHGYVRGGKSQPTVDTIPDKLARPFKESAELLGFKPIVNYAATVLFNWTLIDPDGPHDLRY